MICRNFKHFSQKHAHNFVPLPYQPENNDIPVKTPPSVALDALHTLAVIRIYLDNFAPNHLGRTEAPEKSSRQNLLIQVRIDPRRACPREIRRHAVALVVPVQFRLRVKRQRLAESFAECGG